MPEESQEFARIRKDNETEIVVRTVTFKGNIGLDIREYVSSGRYTGWSKSGVRVPIDEICNLARAIKAACNTLDPDSASSENEVA